MHKYLGSIPALKRNRNFYFKKKVLQDPHVTLMNTKVYDAQDKVIGKVYGSQTRPLTHKPSLLSIGAHQIPSQHLFSHIIIHTTSDPAPKTVHSIPTS